jgi:DNA polymerase-3 subunit gamma/tau
MLASAAVATAVAVETSLEEELRQAVIRALEGANQRMLAAILEGEGEWQVGQDELVIKVARPASFLEMAVTNDARRILTSAVAATAGRSLKVRVESSGKSNGNGHSKGLSSSNGGGESARSRAANDPIVRRMQEKFGAEIRTVIDHREKKR